MNIGFQKTALTILFVASLAACTKEDRKSGPYPLSDVKPAIPVTVSNAADFRPEPTVTTSIAGGGTIQIVLSIPSGTGRTIKEITKVSSSTTYTQVTSGTGVFYNTAVIAGSGTSVTFNTTLTEYFVKKPVSGSNPAAAANKELANRFFFVITLDDNSTIITESVRVLVLA